MPAKWHRYSYSARIEERRTALATLILILSLALAFALIHNYLINMNSFRSITMEPTVDDGDCVITTPLYNANPAIAERLPLLIVPSRGDLVILNSSVPIKKDFSLGVVRSIVAFLTFQKIQLFSEKSDLGETLTIRRLVAFPGDSIYMEDFVLHIKKAGTAHFLTEFELADTEYDVKIDALPANWDSTLPFSGSFDERILKEDEYFVLCDNRITASDSRVWGPVSAERIKGKVLLRYWPVNHFGTL